MQATVTTTLSTNSMSFYTIRKNGFYTVLCHRVVCNSKLGCPLTSPERDGSHSSGSALRPPSSDTALLWVKRMYTLKTRGILVPRPVDMFKTRGILVPRPVDTWKTNIPLHFNVYYSKMIITFRKQSSLPIKSYLNT